MLPFCSAFFLSFFEAQEKLLCNIFYMFIFVFIFIFTYVWSEKLTLNRVLFTVRPLECWVKDVIDHFKSSSVNYCYLQLSSTFLFKNSMIYKKKRVSSSSCPIHCSLLNKNIHFWKGDTKNLWKMSLKMIIYVFISCFFSVDLPVLLSGKNNKW